MHKKRRELNSFITNIFNIVVTQQELVDLTAVEIPSSVFLDNKLGFEESIVDVDNVASGTPHWASGAVKEGKAVINRSDLAEFLDLFEATLGILRLKIDGIKRYFFVYIANGLDPSHIRYLKQLRIESPTATGFSMNEKSWKTFL